MRAPIHRLTDLLEEKAFEVRSDLAKKTALIMSARQRFLLKTSFFSLQHFLGQVEGPVNIYVGVEVMAGLMAG